MPNNTHTTHVAIVKRVFLWVTSIVFAVRFYFLDPAAETFQTEVIRGILVYVVFLLFLNSNLLDTFLKKESNDHRDGF